MNKKSDNNKFKIGIPEFYCIFAFILGLIVSILLPLGQTPDEFVHTKQMCKAFGLEYVYDQYSTVAYQYNLTESAFDGAKIDKELLDNVNKLHFDKSAVQYTPTVNLMMFSYLPAFTGFIIGYILNLPIATCMWLSEFCNLIFAVIIGYFALKLMPVKKHMLLAVMLLPMCIHQYGSINYDAILLPLCFLLFAYCMHLVIEAKTVSWKNVILVLLLMFIIATIKPPYALIGLITLTIPANKINNIIGKLIDTLQKYPLISIISALAVAALALVILKDQRYISLIVASILNPVHYLRLMYHTITYYFEFFYISTLGSFGYLSMPLPKAVVIIMYIYLVITGLKKRSDNKSISIKEKALYVGISFIIFNMVFIAMISHSFLLNGLEYGPLSKTMDSYIHIGRIEGVQGRYFIPILPLMLMCFDIKNGLKGKWLQILEIIYYCMIPVVMLIVIINRLW